VRCRVVRACQNIYVRHVASTCSSNNLAPIRLGNNQAFAILPRQLCFNITFPPTAPNMPSAVSTGYFSQTNTQNNLRVATKLLRMKKRARKKCEPFVFVE
jgi:hypothetical protein